MLLCSDVMDYCRKVSPLEGSKNRDCLLKKLVYVCVCVCVCPCVCVGRSMEKLGEGGQCGVYVGGEGMQMLTLMSFRSVTRHLVAFY